MGTGFGGSPTTPRFTEALVGGSTITVARAGTPGGGKCRAAGYHAHHDRGPGHESPHRPRRRHRRAHASAADVDRLARAAGAAAPVLARLSPDQRAELLRAVAAALTLAREDLVALADAETALGDVRLGGELTRTTVQLEMFADALADGSVLEAVIDLADPAARSAPRPDLRRMLVALGPVAVFAASNFPFAFSVAGGDTASALAAGCPVLVKAHPGHPRLSAAVADIVVDALRSAGAPAGTLRRGARRRRRRALVTHPASRRSTSPVRRSAGRALFDLANAGPIRSRSTANWARSTRVVTPAAVAARGPEIAAGFVGLVHPGLRPVLHQAWTAVPAGRPRSRPTRRPQRRRRIRPAVAGRIRDGFDARPPRSPEPPGYAG